MTSEISITEQQAKTINNTRLFTKKRKDWEGKKKPVRMIDGFTEDEIQTMKDMREYSKKRKLKFDCPYCGAWYYGSWEQDHKEFCDFKLLKEEEKEIKFEEIRLEDEDFEEFFRSYGNKELESINKAVEESLIDQWQLDIQNNFNEFESLNVDV